MVKIIVFALMAAGWKQKAHNKVESGMRKAENPI